MVLRRRVDAHFEAAVAASPGQFACRAGCSDCCRSGLSVFAVEADPIREAIDALPAEARATIAAQGREPDRPWCPLLIDGQCSVYAQRPVLCRSHGLAVRPPAELRNDPAQPYFDHCPLNYTSQTPPRASIMDLDALNQPLAMMARMWGGPRVSLATLARDADRPARPSPSVFADLGPAGRKL